MKTPLDMYVDFFGIKGTPTTEKLELCESFEDEGIEISRTIYVAKELL